LWLDEVRAGDPTSPQSTVRSRQPAAAWSYTTTSPTLHYIHRRRHRHRHRSPPLPLPSPPPSCGTTRTTTPTAPLPATTRPTTHPAWLRPLPVSFLAPQALCHHLVPAEQQSPTAPRLLHPTFLPPPFSRPNMRPRAPSAMLTTTKTTKKTSLPQSPPHRARAAMMLASSSGCTRTLAN
jgi:hypothetical protein